MSMFRRMLLIAKLADSGTQIILDFTDGIVTLNFEGNGTNTTVSDNEVTINE